MPYTVNICQLVQIVDGDRAQNRSEPRRSVTQASQSRPQLTSIRKTITTTTTTSRRFGLSVGGKRLKEQKSRNGDKSKHSTRGEGGKGGGACWVLTNWVTTGQWGRQWQRLCPSCQLERAANTVWWNTSHTLAHTQWYSDYVMSKCSANAVTGRCCHSCWYNC